MDLSRGFCTDRLIHRQNLQTVSGDFFEGLCLTLPADIHPLIMEASDLLSLLEQLDDNVDDLEESLQPLLNRPLIGTSKKLPVLDKAKLYVLTTYALESLLFCKFLPIE